MLVICSQAVCVCPVVHYIFHMIGWHVEFPLYSVFYRGFFHCLLSLFSLHLYFFFSVMGKFWMFTCIALRWESPIKSVSQRADRNAEHPSTKPFRGLPEMCWKNIEGKLVVWLKQVCSLMILASPQLNCWNQIKVFTGFLLTYVSQSFLGFENFVLFLSHSGSWRK